MIKYTKEQFDELKLKGEEFYKSVGEVYCPYLKEKVSFNDKGLEHIKFKQHMGKMRNEHDQYMRFKLLHIVPEILRLSGTVQGIEETKKIERIRMNSRTDLVLKPVTYYEFIAVVKRNRVKIIVKQIDNGQKFFWSIIPFWGMDQETMTRILYEGLPEED
jgi:hypothetical protein